MATLLNGMRLIRHRAAAVADLIDHQRGPGFLTVVAATGVLGAQVMVIGGRQAIAVALLVVAIVLWLVLTYTISTAPEGCARAGAARPVSIGRR